VDDMTRILAALALAACILGRPATVPAQSPPSVWGLGSARCHEYLEAAKRGPALGYIDWLQGFLTAAEWLTRGRVGEPRRAIVWLNEYCRQNAQAPLSTAAMALTNHLADTTR
jgi:hypothetical protein